MSLAWPFLAAGVPEVIAALWRVPDEATAQFLRELLFTHHSETNGLGAPGGAACVPALRLARVAGSPGLAGFAQFGSLQISHG